MKQLLIISTLFISLSSYPQNSFWEDLGCYKIIGDDTMKVDCDYAWPTPVFHGNVDSLCLEMEKRFVETLNEWRLNHGINELEYDYDMDSLLTTPWNESQVREGKISHGEGYNSLRNRSNRVGIRGCGECCASNSRNDKGDVSQFFIQYKNSPPHWSILTDMDFNYISVSVLYDKEKNRYYSVVNVRW
jgi:uncharacterized protein YkwD